MVAVVMRAQQAYALLTSSFFIQQNLYPEHFCWLYLLVNSFKYIVIVLDVQSWWKSIYFLKIPVFLISYNINVP